MKFAVGLSVILSLVSCAPQGSLYPKGEPDLSKSAMFVRVNQAESGITRTTGYWLEAIDGKALGKPVKFTGGEKGYPITPGIHDFNVAVIHGSSAFQEGRLNAVGKIRMKARQGVVYEVAGSVVSAQQVDLWIRDKNTKQRVSEVITVRPQNFSIPHPVLIFLPS